MIAAAASFCAKPARSKEANRRSIAVSSSAPPPTCQSTQLAIVICGSALMRSCSELRFDSKAKH